MIFSLSSNQSWVLFLDGVSLERVYDNWVAEQNNEIYISGVSLLSSMLSATPNARLLKEALYNTRNTT